MHCVLCCTPFPPVRAVLLPCQETLLVRVSIAVMKHRDMGRAGLLGLCFCITVHLQQGRSLKAVADAGPVDGYCTLTCLSELAQSALSQDTEPLVQGWRHPQ